MNVSQFPTPHVFPRLPRPSDEQIGRYLNVVNEQLYEQRRTELPDLIRQNAADLVDAALNWLSLHGITVTYDASSFRYQRGDKGGHS